MGACGQEEPRPLMLKPTRNLSGRTTSNSPYVSVTVFLADQVVAEGAIRRDRAPFPRGKNSCTEYSYAVPGARWVIKSPDGLPGAVAAVQQVRPACS